MKIAIVLPGVGISGGIGIALFYANGLADLGHDVDVINLSGQEYNYWYGEGKYRVLSCNDLDRLGKATHNSYDCAIATFWTTVHHLRSGLINTKAVVYLVQGDERNFYSDDKVLLRHGVENTFIGTEFKVVIAKWLWQKLSSQYGTERFFLLENGIDFARFRDAEPFMEKGDKLRVLVEGPVSEPIKRIHETLALLKCIDGIETWLVSSVEGELRGVYPDLSLFSVPWSSMPSIYKSCHCMIKNSKTEGFPLPVMEMMASGGVPIVNALGYEVGLIDHEINGIVLDNINTDNLSQSLAYVSENHHRMSKMASEKISHYSWSDHVQRLDAIIHQAVGESAPRNLIMKIFTTSNPEAVAEQWVWQGSRPSWSACSKAGDVLVGWIAQQQGGDIHKAILTDGVEIIDITPNHYRPDVERFFSKKGVYGFKNTLPDRGENAKWVIKYQAIERSQTEVLPVKLEPGQYDGDNARVYIESSSKDSRIVMNIDEVAHLKEVFIQFDGICKVWINGSCQMVESVFERSGTIMFDANDCKSVVERYRSA